MYPFLLYALKACSPSMWSPICTQGGEGRERSHNTYRQRSMNSYIIGSLDFGQGSSNHCLLLLGGHCGKYTDIASPKF